MAVRHRVSDLDAEGNLTGYALTDAPAVLAFLDEHPQLRPLLDAARPHLAAAFGPEAPVILELATDPEEGDAALFARVETPLPPRAALARLDGFLDAWWLDALPESGGMLHFDVA